jgi:hypothetical protein
MLLSTTARNSMADALDDDIGATGSARFQNAAQTATYATCNLSNPAFGAAATGVITLSGTPTDTSASAGTTARCGFYDAVAAGNLIFTLGVASSGSPDMTISNTTLSLGDQVEISSLTITVPAGSVDVT